MRLKLFIFLLLFVFHNSILNSADLDENGRKFQNLLNGTFEKYNSELNRNKISYDETLVENILLICIDEIGGKEKAVSKNQRQGLINLNLQQPFLKCVDKQLLIKIKNQKQNDQSQIQSTLKQDNNIQKSITLPNYSLFGENLYKSIDTLEIIGEVYYWDRLNTVWDEKKRFSFAKKNNLINKDSGFIYQYHLVLSPDTKEPVVLDGITDANGLVKLGSGGLPIIPYYENHLIIKPKNKNELFDLYIVTYSAVSKKILTIRAKTKKKYSEDALCLNDIKIWNDYLLDKFRQDSKNIITTDYKKINPNVYLGNVDSFDKLPASEQKIKAAGFVLGKFPTVDKYKFTTARVSYVCSNFSFSDYAWIKLADIDISQKINKDFEILEKKRIENKIKNQGLNKNSNLKGM